MAGVRALGENLFVFDGPAVRDMGVRFDTRMTVVRLADGDLWVASPVAVPFETLEHITTLGTVRYLVSPTPRHYWRLAGWHELFPDAELWSSPITPVTLKEGDLPLAGILGDQLPTRWAGDLDQVLIRGSRWLNEVVFFHPATGTLLVEDVIQIHELHAGRPVRNALIRLGGVSAPNGGVARDIRLTFRDHAAARQSVRRILEWDFNSLVMAHGPVITENARRTVEEAFSWLDDRGKPGRPSREHG